ncbi:hypothetical protein RCO48_39700 [Peribacillus frigoritolerans]|nr:hypothetical protein [Peribacillus frigoritolerans]
MKEVAESSNVILMEAFMYQFHKQHKRVKELLESKIIGEYRHLKAHFSWMLPDENDIRLNPDLGGRGDERRGLLWISCTYTDYWI